MWAQLVKMRTSRGEELDRLSEQWETEVGRGTESGWMRSLTFRRASDPNEWFELVFFESEEKARANEKSELHNAILQQMISLIDGQPEYYDLIPVRESTR